jgi:Holliday junction resolvase RusA-like endonuclease
MPWTVRFDYVGYPVPYELGFRAFKNRVVVWNENSAYKKKYQRSLKAWMAIRDMKMLSGPIKMKVLVLTPRDHNPIHKPDASNIQKTIEDCCNGIVFADDSRVVSIQTIKRRGCTLDWKTRLLVREVRALQPVGVRHDI